MPVTKTAKRALKGSKIKAQINRKIISSLEMAIRIAKKSKKEKDISKAASLTDRAQKKHAIHKNKAARIKSSLAKLSPKKTSKAAKTKKAPKKK
jgi:small subunit ribosomal protein S20